MESYIHQPARILQEMLEFLPFPLSVEM